MRSITIRLLAAAMAMAALAGCETADKPSEKSSDATPGSVRVHMNGQVTTTIGVMH